MFVWGQSESPVYRIDTKTEIGDGLLRNKDGFAKTDSVAQGDKGIKNKKNNNLGKSKIQLID